MNVVALPTRLTVDDLWCRYCALVHQMQADPELLANLAHNQDIARSWSAWRDAFLASERKC
jgi:hypothetical protein